MSLEWIVASLDEQQLPFAVKHHAVGSQRGSCGKGHQRSWRQVSQLLPGGWHRIYVGYSDSSVGLTVTSSSRTTISPPP